jgi:hypothetical protein
VFYTRLVEDLEDLNLVLLKTQSLKDHFACSSGKGGKFYKVDEECRMK